MAPSKPPERKNAPAGRSAGPRKVGMYDRPANAGRPPMTIIIGIVVLLIAILSVAFFYFF